MKRRFFSLLIAVGLLAGMAGPAALAHRPGNSHSSLHDAPAADSWLRAAALPILPARASDSAADVVAAVDENRWYSAVTALVKVDTRHSSTQGNLDARDWLQGRFQADGFETALQEFALEDATSFNVIAELPGRSRPEDVIIVGAHFDSTSQQPESNAPGAEDNASGTAALLEMARIFADHPPEATLRFIAFSGEEQGLVGSTAYANNLSAAELAAIQGVIIMDMIGFTSDAELDVLLETYAWAEPLRAVLRGSAQQWTTLATYNSNNPFGSDHMPFLQRGLQTVLLIQNEWDNYDCYHDTCDLPNQLSKPQGREMMKMLAGALAELAGVCRLSDGACDGRVSIADVQLVAASWNTNANQPGFDVRRDLDHDGDVDLEDVLLAAADWGWRADP